MAAKKSFSIFWSQHLWQCIDESSSTDLAQRSACRIRLWPALFRIHIEIQQLAMKI